MSIHIDAQQLEQIIRSRMGGMCCSILSIHCYKMIHKSTEVKFISLQLLSAINKSLTTHGITSIHIPSQ